jgi:hypothetical protein
LDNGYNTAGNLDDLPAAFFLCKSLAIAFVVKGRIFIVACLALSVGLIAFHLHQLHSVSHSVSAPPAIVPVKKEIVPARPPAETIAAMSHAQPVTAHKITIAATTNAVAGVNAQFESRMALMAWLRDLAATNYAAALEYVSKMPAGEERDDALQAVCFGLARTDPAKAVDLAQQLQVPPSVVENLVQQWAGSDMKDALIWANNQPAGDERDDMIHRIVLQFAAADPSDAIGLVQEQIPPGPNQDEALMTILNQWANKDLAAAAKWVESLPNNALKPRMVAELEGIEQYQQALAHSNN